MTRFPRPFVLILGFLTVLSICLAAQAAGQPGARQGAGGRGMFGGGFGGMMGGRGTTLLTLASNEQVQEKLGLKGQAEAIGKLAEESRGRRGRGFPEGFRDMTQEQRAAALKEMRAAGEKARKEREAMTEEQREEARQEARAAREKAQKEQDAKLKGLVGKAKYNQLVEMRAGLVLQQSGPTAVLDPGIAALLKLTDKQKEAIQKVIEKLNADRMKLFEGLRGRGRRGGAAAPGAGAGGPSLNSQVVFVAAARGGGRRPASPEMEKIRAKADELRRAANKAISEILTKAQKAKITALMKAVEGIELRRGGFRRPGAGERPAGREGRPRGGRRGTGAGPEA